MSIHDAFLELAATEIDFELDPAERAELERHIAGCEACRRATDAMRDDANAIAYSAGPQLSPMRSEAILAAALRPPKSGPPLRLLAIGALVAIFGVGLLAAGELIRRSQQPGIAGLPTASGFLDAGPSGGPGSPSLPTSRPSSGSPHPAASPAAGELPVRGSGQQLGTEIKMAPGPDGDLYVSIPGQTGTTLVRLDAGGKAAPGWPIVLPGAPLCSLLLTAPDGSVRAVCYTDDLVSELVAPPVRAFAFDAGGDPLPGWPVDIPCCFTGRLVGDQLTMFVREYFGDVEQEGQPAGNSWIVTVAADGAVASGTQVPFALDCCIDTWAVGPDGVAYGTVHDFSGAAPSSQLTAVHATGVPNGFPVAIDGIASGPSFDLVGGIHVTVGSPQVPPARTLVFGTDGRPINSGSSELDLTATSDWNGAGGDFPAPPLVSGDGTTFVIDDSDGTTVVGLGSAGQEMRGWPYRSKVGLQETGFCGPGDTGCGSFRAAPAIGRFGILYLVHAAAKSSAGGSVVAVDEDGRVRGGWPVGLRRPGAAFWSIVAAADGTAFALAIEPEPNGSHSATILSLALNSTVGYTTTVVEP